MAHEYFRIRVHHKSFVTLNRTLDGRAHENVWGRFYIEARLPFRPTEDFQLRTKGRTIWARNMAWDVDDECFVAYSDSFEIHSIDDIKRIARTWKDWTFEGEHPAAALWNWAREARPSEIAPQETQAILGMFNLLTEFTWVSVGPRQFQTGVEGLDLFIHLADDGWHYSMRRDGELETSAKPFRHPMHAYGEAWHFLAQHKKAAPAEAEADET